MEFLSTYAESDDEETQKNNIDTSKIVEELARKKKQFNIAPNVDVVQQKSAYQPSEAREIYWNPEYEAFFAPVQGPQHPVLSKPNITPGGNNVLTGFAADTHYDHFSWEQQHNDFTSKGYAVDPDNSNAVIGRVDNYVSGDTKHKRKRQSGGKSSDVDGYLGPWAPYEDEVQLSNVLKELADAEEQQDEETGKKKKEEPKKQKQIVEEEKEEEKEPEVIQAKSIYHGTHVQDYQGRSFVDPPSDMKQLDHECFLPKRFLHTWTGHNKPVQAIRFFPKAGHLILSASFDTKVKIWDVYNKMQVIRTYIGHSKAVRDICFSNDGRKFISAGLDKQINLWDTETGDCIGSYSNGKTPYCVKFNPDPNRQHLFLAGCSDKKIVQYDTNSGKIVQVYEGHLGAVNTITFVDNNRRFVTSSDDKSIRVWEFGIPVVIKYISEPHMHAMPAVAAHPDGTWFIGQSMDNQILVYSTTDKFRQHKKKVFKGHITAGYACELGFSPDGRFVYSGDSNGNLWFWDWKTTRVLKTMKVHQAVTIGALWHPIEPSRVATCSWDGTIKYWD